MVRMRSPVRIWLSAPRDHLCKQLRRGDFLFGTARGGRMTEGNRKQKRSRARQASVGDQRLFLKIPAVRFLRNHSRFYGAVSAARAGLFRADGAASAPGGRLRKGVLRKDPIRAWERPPGCFRVTDRLLPLKDDRIPGTRTASAKRWKRIPAIGKNACAIYKRIRLIYTTHMGKNGRGSIRCRIGRAKPSPVGGERMRCRQIASNRIFIRKRN